MGESVCTAMQRVQVIAREQEMLADNRQCEAAGITEGDFHH